MGAKAKEIARLTGKNEIRVGQILTAGMAIATKEGLALKMLCTASRFFPTSDAAYRFAYLSGLGDEFVDGVFVRIAEYGVSKEAGQQGEGEESGGEEDEDNYLAHVFPTKKPQAHTREGFIALVAFFFLHYRISTTKKLGDQIREEMDTRFPTKDPITLAARCEFVTTITTMKVDDIGVARVPPKRDRAWLDSSGVPMDKATQMAVFESIVLGPEVDALSRFFQGGGKITGAPKNSLFKAKGKIGGARRRKPSHAVVFIFFFLLSKDECPCIHTVVTVLLVVWQNKIGDVEAINTAAATLKDDRVHMAKVIVELLGPWIPRGEPTDEKGDSGDGEVTAVDGGGQLSIPLMVTTHTNTLN